jgi:S1-C subfamily serine protease
MRKHLLSLSIILFVAGQFLNGFGQTSESSVTAVVQHSAEAVVLIVISDGSGKEVTLGSGFIISADGKIVTNFHVIKDAKSAIVKLSNGASFNVDGVLATDSEKDLAIIKVQGRNLAHFESIESETARIGDHVVAIGSPLGLEGSVSDGIISAVREENGKKWIQTTAPVSHGNSGGPLLDMKGNVVGVITWGVNTQYGQNLNFAAPGNEIKTLLASMNQPIRPLVSTSTNPNLIKRLKDVKKIAIGSLGNSDAANLVKEKLINRLISSGKISIVENSSEADAILAGIVGADIYGRADTAALRLTTLDGRSLWGGETSGKRGRGSASSGIAEKLAKQLIDAINKD